MKPSARSVAVLTALGLAAPAAAQQRQPRNSGYDADIELVRPLNAPDILPGIDISANERPGTVRGGVVIQYLRNPLVLYEFEEEVGSVVANRTSVYLGASADLTRAISIRASVPLHVQFGTEVPRYAADGFGLGDTNLGMHAVLVRRPKVGFGLSADLTLPTSRPQFYMGERLPKALAGIIFHADAGRVRFASNLLANGRFRSVETKEEFTLTTELVWNNGLRVNILPDKLSAGLSIYSRFGLGNFFGAAESSGEALLSLAYRPLPIMNLTLSGGRGFTQGYGSSDARVMVSLDFRRIPPVKVDPDTFTDTTNPDGTDPGGLRFNVRDIGQIKAEGEGEGDLTEAEWEEGVLAKIDVRTDKIVIREAIRFKVNTADLLDESLPTLDYIARLLNEDARIAHIVIEGHASEDGDFEPNYKLSESRAASIWRRLLQQGVHPTRISLRGMGEVSPVPANEQFDELQASRRVEFHIVRQLEAWEEPPVYDLDLKYPWNGQPYRAVQPLVPDPDDELPKPPKKKADEEEEKPLNIDFSQPADDDEIDLGAPTPAEPTTPVETTP